MRAAQIKIALLATFTAVTIAFTDLLGATITWTVFDITDSETDVSTSGGFVQSKSGSPSVSYEVNGVTFAAGRILDATTRDRPAGIPASLDDAYESLLSTASADTSRNPASITLSGLTSNSLYEIQIWASDTNALAGGSGPGDTGLVLNNDESGSFPTHGESGHATLLYWVATNAPGQYAKGTFTADGTSQSFAVRRWSGLDTASPLSNPAENFVNAIQIREIPPPPKGTVLVIR